MEITPHLYRLFRACVLGFHVLSLVYFVCFAYASYTDIYSSSDPSTALPASVQPTTSSGIVLLIQVITSALHLVRIKSLMTAACFHRAEYIPTKRPAAFYHRMFLWLSFHDLLVVLTHSYHGMLLYSFVQSRLLVLAYLVFVWVYSILPCFRFKRLFLRNPHLRLVSLAYAVALDVLPGICLRIWWMFACDDPIAHVDAADFTTGAASAFPPLLLLSTLTSLSSLVTKLKPARSPQKVRRVTHGPASPLRFDFTEPTMSKQSKWCLTAQRASRVGSVLWISAALSMLIYALTSHPSALDGCVLLLRRPFTTVPVVCRSFQIACDSTALHVLLDLPPPTAAFVMAVQFANCPALAFDAFDRVLWPNFRRLELINTTVTSASSATYPMLLHVVLSRSSLSKDATTLLPPSLMSLEASSSRLPDDVLPPLPLLRTLDLRHTPLRSFDGAAMPRLVHAAVLHAQLAILVAWPANNLVDLWLSGNPLHAIPDEMLNLPRLLVLAVDRTNLDRVGDRVSSSLLHIIATDTPLCRSIAAFLTHAQIQYTHGDTSLVQC
ncbi:hypothetical protein DYB28_014506 [Aphanomyces astaci]|uniref:Uncharacterized protein n=1 Tax=Aphanomyces astaci TaxID=112090 RepID=A0A397DBK0_APHAT|nr:hypothetical protein DYB38_005656 [Aphanomyces astaci]RHZ42445.1 hypothetical protein DYB26_002290 [Aphanomyces astaci]RLO09231.1 hypothetical protein DYB28_014506 [Aphanomyces astaci]